MLRLRQAGFTLLELVVVVAVVSLLLTVALLSMHPKDTSVTMRNAERQLDTAQIMQALNRYVGDHQMLPDGLTGTPQVMGSQPGELNICKNFVPAYLKDMPRDPETGGVLALTGKTCNEQDVFYSTGYTIARAADGTVTIAAPDAEAGAHVQVSRRF